LIQAHPCMICEKDCGRSWTTSPALRRSPAVAGLYVDASAH
jgi:hypothetical protein